MPINLVYFPIILPSIHFHSTSSILQILFWIHLWFVVWLSDSNQKSLYHWYDFKIDFSAMFDYFCQWAEIVLLILSAILLDDCFITWQSEYVHAFFERYYYLINSFTIEVFMISKINLFLFSIRILQHTYFPCLHKSCIGKVLIHSKLVIFEDY